MNVSDFDYQILKLSESFYKSYSITDFSEIERKEERAYNCLLIETHYDYYICVPYRSNVKHGNAFHFKKSKRSKSNLSALDYSKIVIVKNKEYLSSPAFIDNDEYVETVNNINHIKNAAVKYVEDYILYTTGKKNNSKSFERKYKYTTLKYFHEILNIGVKNLEV